MSSTTLAAGVPHCWQLLLGPHPKFLHIQYWGTVNVVDHSAAKSSGWRQCRRHLMHHQNLLTTLHNLHLQLHHKHLHPH